MVNGNHMDYYNVGGAHNFNSGVYSATTVVLK